MKNSGVEWIGEIPEDWEVTQVKNIFNIGRGRVIAQTELDEHGKYPVYSSQTKDNGCLGYINTYDFDINQLTWTTDGANAGTVFLRKGKHNCTNVCGTLQLKQTSNILLFYKYALEYLTIFNKRADTNGFKIMNNEMAKIITLLPPKETQQRIATYLDKKCSKIEETIQNQQQVIEKLKAYKQSLITEAVTGKIKIQSEIPDFKYCNLGFIAEFKNGLNYNASDFGTEVKFLGVGDFQNYLVLNDESMFSNIITDTEIEDDYYLKNGDIIFVRSNGSKELVGRAIMVDNIDFKVTYSGFCIRLRNKEPKKINSKFLLYFFRSDYFRNELQRLSQGSNISNINQDLLSHIKIPLVDIRFQESVVDFLNKKCTAIDTVIEQKQKLIEKLTEYKKSMIYECVTGKKEI